jgi:hypothetical protein
VEPTGAEVRSQLGRLLASEGFANAERISRFLRFVVERTLDGEGDQLKEYRLGTEVFDRPSDYDPRLDSIVRVEARRLRAKLAEYYAGPGQGDPVLIGVDKGSYAARFDAAVAPDTPAEADRVTTDLVEQVPARPTAARWPAPVLGALIILAVLVIGWRLVARDTAPHPRAFRWRCCRWRATTPRRSRCRRLPTRSPMGWIAGAPGIRTSTSRPASCRSASGAPRCPRSRPRSARRRGRRRPGGVDGPEALARGPAVDARRNRKVWEDFTGETANRRELERRVAAALARVLESRFGTGGTVE